MYTLTLSFSILKIVTTTVLFLIPSPPPFFHYKFLYSRWPRGVTDGDQDNRYYGIMYYGHDHHYIFKFNFIFPW